MVGVLYFSAPWCGPCKQFGPLMERVSQDLGIDVQKIDVEQEPQKAGEYGVMSLPTTVWFKNGEFVRSRSGAMPESALRDFVSSL